ncbi:sulfatase [Micromonospora sp. R77]|uniref:sulfatase n=1 Tax=Micromonospora sp. R77 TaxID=2925836 RepID=UPI001F605568|nr:sulfatase [Micromonospora sp. R77]MCI4065686.1 sulfatase [Micromonospora sp. R77]
MARRTGTASAFGARFDMEIDAFLILVLSAHLAPALGGWVLAIGVMRYAFVAASALLPRLRGTLPARCWRKVVAAAQGVALAVAAAGVLPPVAATVLVAGRWRCWSSRSATTSPGCGGTARPPPAPVSPVGLRSRTPNGSRPPARSRWLSSGSRRSPAGRWPASPNHRSGSCRRRPGWPPTSRSDPTYPPGTAGKDHQLSSVIRFRRPTRKAGTVPAQRPPTEPSSPAEPASPDDRASSGGPSVVREERAAGGFDRPRGRRVRAGAVTVLAAVLVLGALVLPDRVGRLTPPAFLRIPVEGLVAAGLLLALPARVRRPVAVLLGVALGLLTVLKLLDMGFFVARDRPFDVLLDWGLLDDGFGFARDAIGPGGAVTAAIGVGLLVVALPVLLALALLRLTRLAAAHHRVTVRAVAALAVLWLGCAVFGVRVSPGLPVADRTATALVAGHAGQVRDGLRDRRAFVGEQSTDAFRDTPGDRLLTGLRGKDVVVAFVESYGRDAVEDPEFAPQVDAVLDRGYRQLRDAGFDARSGFLTSPTYGGGSWLAHATLLSGLWIDNDQRHRDLLAGDRMTLGGAFHRAGWQTVGVLPAATQPWPEGKFFGYDRYYDAEKLAYRGPKFSYAPMPDQYTLATFQRLERSKPHPPLMAEIPLVSSHSPWSAIPEPVDWDAVGDGSIFHRAATTTGGARDVVQRSSAQVRADYRRSIEYTLDTLVSYVRTYGGDDLVLVFLGDHQPAAAVTGEGASRDVPITVVAHDPAVFDRIADWGWQDGLRPGPQAPVWRMDTFRDRFLTAFGPTSSR